MADWCPVSSTTSTGGPRTYGAPSSISRSSSTASRFSERDQGSGRGSPALSSQASPIDFQSLLLNSPPTPWSLSAVSSAMSGEDDGASVSGASVDESDNTPSSTSDDCVICGERATGNHFGAMSCEACKSFFRRTIRKKHVYKCRMTLDCDVNRETRNHCQYCRLQKCYRSGMRKNLVQDERHSSSLKPMLPLVRKKLAPLLNAYTCPTEPAPMPAISTLQEVDFFGMLPRTDASILMQHVLDAERKMAERHTVPSYAAMATSLEDVAQAVREQLLHVIDWAKLLQEFKDLSEERQAKSLKVCWMEIMVLTLATQRQTSDDSVFIGAHHLLSREDCFDEELQKLIGRLIDELILPFRAMNLTDKEKACIRGLLYFSPEKHSGDLELSKKMNYYQEQLMAELEEHCTIDHRHSRNRYGKLLLRVSALQAVSAELWRYLSMRHLFFRGNRVAVLLCTMLNVPEEKLIELINFTGGRNK